MEENRDKDNDKDIISLEVLERIEKEIKKIKHGTITLIIQDSHVIQMNKFEKIRFR
ncbi:DUF2292 domain-containing protein [Heliobacillus mobilis]|uniref:DUF2292 domain-containing protein n=1 Tax=Heliobacterium mobile TaxID=28064 RepID=A0A6I3SJF5_HELMO|nr:YezD family protein [Heliobacterium mobile]MTV48905.1 DUF2292 domain-containing protein [Heliobacterium mobile]